MIDKDLLRRLGWSEELISEVTRGVESLRATPGGTGVVPAQPAKPDPPTSGSELYFNRPDTNTSLQLPTRAFVRRKPAARPTLRQ
ncbi:MAG: hypothetical protein HY321_20290 [Armatimonadetes bacterium]|nr:hypothetical protein [Armatimonadota bacterium]